MSVGVKGRACVYEILLVGIWGNGRGWMGIRYLVELRKRMGYGLNNIKVAACSIQRCESRYLRLDGQRRRIRTNVDMDDETR